MKNKVLNENYITIQGWMINELQLKGNELMIYAIIYGFSQLENQRFTGSLKYLADLTNSTKQGVIKCLKSLIKKNLIVKEDKIVNGVKFCEYYTTKFNGVLNKVEQGITQSLIGGIKQSLPNNIDIYNIEDNIKNNINNKEMFEYDWLNEEVA
jgi:DNA-binding MarR family transcriptional regulator